MEGEIRPRSSLPGDASAILGCPNLEIPASDDQRCTWLKVATTLENPQPPSTIIVLMVPIRQQAIIRINDGIIPIMYRL